MAKCLYPGILDKMGGRGKGGNGGRQENKHNRKISFYLECNAFFLEHDKGRMSAYVPSITIFPPTPTMKSSNM